MRTRRAALLALALLPALLTGCSAQTSVTANGMPASTAAPVQKQVAVPDIRGQNLKAVEGNLAALGLTYSVQTGGEAMLDSANWQVDAQAPAPGNMLNEGQPITLSASKVTPTVMLPDVSGLTGKQAKQEMQTLGLAIKWDADVVLASNWVVTGTAPGAGSELKVGDTVTINVTRPPSYYDTSTSDSDSSYSGDSSSSGAHDSSDSYSYEDDNDYSDTGGDYSDSSGDSDSTAGNEDGYEINNGEGNGYEVKCNDGSISHSGGLRGACSWHGGVAG